MKQIDLFSAPKNQSASKFVSIYRVSLVKDKSISFGQRRMNNSQEAQSLIQGQGSVSRLDQPISGSRTPSRKLKGYRGHYVG